MMKREKEFFDKHQDEILEILKKHEVVQAYIDLTADYPTLRVQNPYTHCARIKRDIQDLYIKYNKSYYLQVLTMIGMRGELFTVESTWTKLPLNEPSVQPVSYVSATPMIVNNEEESSYKGSEDHKRKYASVSRKEKEGEVSTNQENDKVKENQTEEGEWVRRESNKRRRDCSTDVNNIIAK